MAVYKNLRQDSPLASVEFTPVSDGNFSFFTLKSPDQKDGFRQWLTSQDIGQHIIAETQVDGKPVLVTHGDKSKKELEQAIAERGDKLKFQPPPRKRIDTWKIISMFAVPGQAMQFTSAFMKKGKVQWDLFVFAASSLAGHFIGWIYGSQKSKDENREDFIKHNINKELDGHQLEGARLPDIQDHCSSKREEPPAPQNALQKVNAFLKKNSVTFGELFLRYFGAIALAFPVNRWKAGLGHLKTGSFKAAYKAAANESPYLQFTGLASMFGKTIALFAKAPDPYNQKPKTWLDTLREKYIFNIGGNIEAVAFATMSYEGFVNPTKNPKNMITWPNRKFIPPSLRGLETKNYLSGVGASMFATRYVIRNWAKYGEKEIDMKEIQAHVTDSLATLTPEKLPQLLADTAADLTMHFKDKHLEFGQVYTQLKNDLYRYHHIPLDKLGTSPEERIAKMNGNGKANGHKETPTEDVQKITARKPIDRVAVPAASFAEDTAKAPSPTQRGMA